MRPKLKLAKQFENACQTRIFPIIVRNLIPFHTMGLQSKTEALFGKMIIDFFVAFYPFLQW